MQTTLQHLSAPTVSERATGEARAWVARRLAWEDRLDDLEHHVRPVVDVVQRHGGAAA
jgi:hypothetical protein